MYHPTTPIGTRDFFTGGPQGSLNPMASVLESQSFPIAVNTSLKLIASVTKGIGLSPTPPSSSSNAASVYDSNHFSLALYRDAFPNGTLVILVKVTNIGSQEVALSQLNIWGQNDTNPNTVFASYVVGCTTNTTQPDTITQVSNGVTTFISTTATIDCGNLASTQSFVMKPGQTFSALISSNNNFVASNGFSINDFSASASYSVTGIQGEFVMNTEQP